MWSICVGSFVYLKRRYHYHHKHLKSYLKTFEITHLDIVVTKKT